MKSNRRAINRPRGRRRHSARGSRRSRRRRLPSVRVSAPGRAGSAPPAACCLRAESGRRPVSPSRSKERREGARRLLLPPSHVPPGGPIPLRAPRLPAAGHPALPGRSRVARARSCCERGAGSGWCRGWRRSARSLSPQVLSPLPRGEREPSP